MSDPVSERAHYVTVDRWSSDLLLVQQGRVESPGLVPVIWRWPKRRDAGTPGAGTPGSRPRGSLTHAAAALLLLLL
jgi:hypothetical protein